MFCILFFEFCAFGLKLGCMSDNGSIFAGVILGEHFIDVMSFRLLPFFRVRMRKADTGIYAQSGRMAVLLYFDFCDISFHFAFLLTAIL